MIYFSTWMYEESATDQGYYFQVGGDVASPQKKLIYWRCVLVFFTLAHQHVRHRDDIQLCLFTNARHLPDVDGVNLRAYLESLNVKIIYLEYRWRPNFPKKEWYNQFYIFDILDYFEVSASEADHFIIADSDCMCVESPKPLWDQLREDGHITIDVDTDADEDINGISRREAAALYGALGGTKQPLIAPYFGGEFFGISGYWLGSFLALSRDAFAINNRRAGSGYRYLTEEAHLISYAFVQLGVTNSNADHHLRRIWTSWKSNNTQFSDLDLSIWHVPAEKLFGIKAIASRISTALRKGKPVPVFTKANLSSVLGVGRRRLSKMAWTFTYAVLRRIRENLLLLKKT